MRTKTGLGLCLLALMPVGTALTQEAGRSDRPVWSLLQQRFEKEAPKVGQALPEVTAFDEKGQPFRLGQLKGRYTVLVFGCLT